MLPVKHTRRLFQNLINNMSGHVTILLILSLAAEHDENNDSRQYVKRVHWDKATVDNSTHYKRMLDKFCAQLKLSLELYIAKIHRVRYILMH